MSEYYILKLIYGIIFDSTCGNYWIIFNKRQEEKKKTTETFSKQGSLPNIDVSDKSDPITDVINSNADLTSNLMNVK